MSARRQARGRTLAAVVTAESGIPRVFLLGRCIDVWAEDPAEVGGGMDIADMRSAKRRFDAARNAWLDRAGVTDVRERSKAIPAGSAYSLTYLESQGRGESGVERLARADCHPSDIPRLRREAETLIGAVS